jgi:hypothetical protein
VLLGSHGAARRRFFCKKTDGTGERHRLQDMPPRAGPPISGMLDQAASPMNIASRRS